MPVNPTNLAGILICAGGNADDPSSINDFNLIFSGMLITF